jgi:hypothetical protein
MIEKEEREEARRTGNPEMGETRTVKPEEGQRTPDGIAGNEGGNTLVQAMTGNCDGGMFRINIR